MQFHRPQQIRLFLDFSVSISCNGKNRFNHYIDSIPHRHSSPISTITKTKKKRNNAPDRNCCTPPPQPLSLIVACTHCIAAPHCHPYFAILVRKRHPNAHLPPLPQSHQAKSLLFTNTLAHCADSLRKTQNKKIKNKKKKQNEEKSSKQTKSGEKHWFSTHSCIIADMGMTSDNIKCIQPSDFQGNTYNYYVCYMHRTQKCIYKWVLRMEARACTAYKYIIYLYTTHALYAHNRHSCSAYRTQIHFYSTFLSIFATSLL